MLRKVACAFVLCVAFGMAAYAYELQASKINSWELTFSAKAPRAIRLTEADMTVYYTYVIYEISNGTSQDIDYAPSIHIEAENGKTYTAAIYPAAEAAIKMQDGRDIIGLKGITGNIKPGEKKRGMAVFKAVDGSSDKLTLYVTGLSGDFKNEKAADGKVVTMYRTYKAVYYRPGDEWHVLIDPVTLKDSEWVWRP